MKEINPVLLKKLGEIKKTINRNIFERKAETEGILLAILSNTSCLFIGDVGTAKTMHLRLASKLLGLSVFDILLSETTKPENIFGPVDIPALAEGKQLTKIKGYAPDSEILFFDEIFKANGIVLFPLLGLINEKEYRNGDDGVIKCPTKAVFAASNEIPQDATLRAVYDRLLLRFKVDYLKTRRSLKKMVDSHLDQKIEKFKPILSHDQTIELMDVSWKVKVPNEIKEVVFKIRDQVQLACSFKISDRRLAKAFHIMQCHALLNGRTEVNITDTEILSAIFWDKPEQIVKVSALTLSHSSADIADLLSYAEMAESIWETAIETGEMKASYKKLRDIYRTTKKFDTRTGRSIASQVKEILNRTKEVLKQRGDFIVLKIVTSNSEWYKLSTASSLVWTKEQLRSVGFKWRRKAQYWWHEGPKTGHSKKFQRKFVKSISDKLHVIPKIKVIGKK